MSAKQVVTTSMAALVGALVLGLLVPVLPPAGTGGGMATAGAATTGGVVERADVVYGSVRLASGKRRKLRLDLWRPTNSETGRAAVIMAHGGAFRTGTRKHRRLRALAVRLAERGYVTASISYRLRRPDGRTKGGVQQVVKSRAARVAQHDLQAAVRYFRHRADKLGVDKDRIAVLGNSAGAIAALRAAFNPEDPGRSGHRSQSSEVAAVVSLWGTAVPGMIESGAPPALMFHGKQDVRVPFKLARRTCKATRRQGNICRSIWWRREGHGVWHRDRKILRTTVRFLRRHV